MMRAVNDESAGRYGGEARQAGGHPVPRRDRLDRQRFGSLFPHRLCDDGMQRCPVRLVAEEHLDQPGAVLVLEHRERAFVGIEQFGEDARDPLRVRFRTEARDETIVHGSQRLGQTQSRRMR
jgi:hypothetical protein